MPHTIGASTNHQEKIERLKKEIESIKVSYSKLSFKNDTAFEYPLLKLLTGLKGKRFDDQIHKYEEAKLSSYNVKKQDFLDAFLPHCIINGNRKLKDHVTDQWDHNAWSMSGLFHFDLDHIASEDYQEVKSKLLTLNPLFLFKSPNGGIKCFFKHDLKDTLENRQIFQRLIQCQSKMMLSNIGLSKYYDQSPTTPTSKCYVSGGVGFDFTLNINFQIVPMFLAIQSVSDLANNELKIQSKISKLEKQARYAGDLKTWFDLTETHKTHLFGYAESNLNKAVASSTNKGNKQSFTLATSLFNLGMDRQTVTQYVTRLKRMLPNSTFNINTQVNAAQRTTGKPFTGCKLVDNSQCFVTIKKLNNELIKNHQQLKVLTYSDDKVENVVIEKAEGVKPLLSQKSSNETKITAYAGIPGCGKSYRLVKESVDLMRQNKVVIYPVHDIKSMSKTEKDSRYEMIESELKKSGDLVEYTSDIQKVHTIYSDINNDDPNKALNVKIQFDNVMAGMQHGEGAIILCTTAGFKFFDFSLLPSGAVLHMDDSNDSPNVSSKKIWKTEDLQWFNDHVKVEHNEGTMKVVGITEQGITFLNRESGRSNEAPKLSQLKDGENANKTNLDVFYVTEINEDSNQDVYRTEILSVNCLQYFDDIKYAGDEIQNNPYLLMWQRTSGIKVNIEQLKNRKYSAEILEQRLKMYVLTEHTYSNNRVNTEQYISIKLGDTLAERFPSANMLICQNLRQKDIAGGLLATLQSHGIYNAINSSPMTKGRNDLMDNNVVVCSFSCDANPHVKRVNSKVTGISEDEFRDYTHSNQMMQNTFRGVLRNAKSKEVCHVIYPDLRSAQYVLNRLNNEFNTKLDIEIVILDNELSEMFKGTKGGRKIGSNTIKSSGVSLTGREKDQLKRLRATYGKDEINTLITFYEVSILLERLEGTKGKTRVAEIEKLTEEMKKEKAKFEVIKPIKCCTDKAIKAMALDALPDFKIMGAKMNEEMKKEKELFAGLSANDNLHTKTLMKIVPKNSIYNFNFG